MRLENNGRSRRGLFRLALDAVTSSLVVATAAGAARADPTAAPRKDVELINLPVAGAGYYQACQAAAGLWLAQRLTLRREPNNPYDADAIEAYAERVKLGYLPRAQNTIIARLMDAGRPIEGRVQLVGAERESRWVDIGMTIVLRG